MKSKMKEVYVCSIESAETGMIDRYDMIRVPESIHDINNPRNIIKSFPVYRSAGGNILINSEILHSIATLQNEGYTVTCFF